MQDAKRRAGRERPVSSVSSRRAARGAARRKQSRSSWRPPSSGTGPVCPTWGNPWFPTSPLLVVRDLATAGRPPGRQSRPPAAKRSAPTTASGLARPRARVPEDERRSGCLGDQAHHGDELQRDGNVPHTPNIGSSRRFVEWQRRRSCASARSGAVQWGQYDGLPREPAVRPPARPLRVLDPRRGVQDPGACAEGRGARDAGSVPDRPRLDGGRDRALQGGQGPGRQADRRLRGLRGRRPPQAAQGPRAPDAPRRRQRRLREPHQALLTRLPRGLLLQAARRLGAPRAVLAGADRFVGLPVRAASPARLPRAALRTPRPSSTGSSSCSGATMSTSSCRTPASTCSSRSCRRSPS